MGKRSIVSKFRNAIFSYDFPKFKKLFEQNYEKIKEIKDRENRNFTMHNMLSENA